MRVAFDIHIDGEHYSTMFCTPDKILKTIRYIKDTMPRARIKRTFLADDYGTEIQEVEPEGEAV